MDLTEDEQHVRRASVGSEVTLALWDAVFGDGWYEPVKPYSGKYIASDGE